MYPGLYMFQFWKEMLNSLSLISAFCSALCKCNSFQDWGRPLMVSPRDSSQWTQKSNFWTWVNNWSQLCPFSDIGVSFERSSNADEESCVSHTFSYTFTHLSHTFHMMWVFWEYFSGNFNMFGVKTYSEVQDFNDNTSTHLSTLVYTLS